MNKNNQSDGLHRFPEWPECLYGITKNPYNKGHVNHKEYQCAVHVVWVSVCVFITKLLQFTEKKNMWNMFPFQMNPLK